MPSCEGVVTLDLEPVTLDMSTIPLEDVIELRKDHQRAHKAYMRSLRGFMVELGRIEDSEERRALLTERRQEIADLANDNRGAMERSVGKNLGSYSMGIAGGVWSIFTGDILGTTLGALGFGPDLMPKSKEKSIGAYSYLFTVSDTFRKRSRFR